MKSLHLYTSPNSRGRIVRWMLDEIGEPYSETILLSGKSRLDDDLLKLNPMGKVPVVVHQDAVITEAAAICAYLADAFPEKGLAPANSERANYYRWFFFAAGPFEAAMTNELLGFQVSEEAKPSVGYGSFVEVLDTLEGELTKRSYIAGEWFTAADVYLATQLGLGMMLGGVEPRRVFQDYWQRLSNRPGYIRSHEKETQLVTV